MAWNFLDSFRTSPLHGGGESWIAFPQYFKNSGYDTRGSGKTYHEGNPQPVHNFDINLSHLSSLPPTPSQCRVAWSNARLLDVSC